jgi:hypothetical protein
MMRVFILITVLIFSVTSALADEPTSRPAGEPTSQPASQPNDVAPAVMQLLKDMEAAGGRYKTIQSDVTMEIIDRLTGDSEKRTGWIAYRKGVDEKNPGGFRVHFATLKQGDGPTIEDNLDYAFDGQYLTVAKHRIKNMTRYQVAAEGEKAEPMKLGQGPFPLPFGQNAEEVVSHFEVTSRPREEADPKDTTYLKFIPRKDQREEINFRQMEMWVNPKTALPVKITSRDKDKKNTLVIFENLVPNAELDPRKTFTMDRPAGWDYKVERWENESPE